MEAWKSVIVSETQQISPFYLPPAFCWIGYLQLPDVNWKFSAIAKNKPEKQSKASWNFPSQISTKKKTHCFKHSVLIC